jgi:hypothetical protein
MARAVLFEGTRFPARSSEDSLMRLFRNGILVVAALSLCTTAAFAGHGRGHAYGHYKNKRYVESCPQPVYVQSAPVYVQPAPVVYRACAPRYVTYYPQQVMVVRPTPFVQVGARFGSITIGAVFGGHQRYQYGCNFCDAHFSSYGAYENHVHNCAYRPANTRIECRQWDDQGYSQWQGRSPSSCRRSNDRYYEEDDRGYSQDDRYDDRRYDNQDDQGGYYDGR